jgi:hypothetical protein
MRVSKCLLILALLFPAVAFAQTTPKWGGKTGPAPGTKVSFKGCPIFIGIEGGCWVAINNGVVYGLGGAKTTPMKGLTTEVKGTVSDKIAICPGYVLDPIEITITRQKCTPPKWPLPTKK